MANKQKYIRLYRGDSYRDINDADESNAVYTAVLHDSNLNDILEMLAVLKSMGYDDIEGHIEERTEI